MWKPWRNFEGPAKLLVILATIFLISSGLCGLQLAVANLGRVGDSVAGALMPLGVIELIAILLSATGIVIVLVFWATRSAYRLVTGRGEQSVPKQGRKPQTLFDRDDGNSN
jgi:hypothetical protein